SLMIGMGTMTGVCVSPDSKWVCLPTGGGNRGGLPNHPQVKLYSTYIYPVENITRPAFVIHQGPYPTVVAFAPISQRVFSQNVDKSLLVCDMKGQLLQEYDIAGRNWDVVDLVVHPKGQGLFLAANHFQEGGKVFWVQFSK